MTQVLKSITLVFVILWSSPLHAERDMVKRAVVSRPGAVVASAASLPTDIGGLQIWLSAQTATTAWESSARTTNSTLDDDTGNAVVFLDDLSGNSYDFERDEPNKQTPRFVIANGSTDEGRGTGPDNQPFFSFPTSATNGNRTLICENATVGQFDDDEAFTLVGVVKPYSASARVISNWGTGNAGWLWDYYSGAWRWNLRGASSRIDVRLTATQTSWYYIVAIWDGTGGSQAASDWTVFSNGVEQSLTVDNDNDPGSSLGSQAIWVGGIPSISDRLGEFNFAELMVFNTALSESDRAILDSYIGGIYPSLVP